MKQQPNRKPKRTPVEIPSAAELSARDWYREKRREALSLVSTALVSHDLAGVMPVGAMVDAELAVSALQRAIKAREDFIAITKRKRQREVQG